MGVKGVEEAHFQTDSSLLSGTVLPTLAFVQGPQNGQFCFPDWQGASVLPMGIFPGNNLADVGDSLALKKKSLGCRLGDPCGVLQVV